MTMSRWISDAYIARLLKNNRLLQGNCEYKLWEQEIDKQVDAMPSINIVRCKECIHGDYDEYLEQYVCIAHDQDLFDADHFCSYGKAKDND